MSDFEKFKETRNLIYGLSAIHRFYMEKIDSLSISEQIGLILYDSFIKDNSGKFFKMNFPGDFFKDTAFKFDSVYSAACQSLDYKDGTENKNTIYSVLFGIMLEINSVFNEENLEDTEDTEDETI